MFGKTGIMFALWDWRKIQVSSTSSVGACTQIDHQLEKEDEDEKEARGNLHPAERQCPGTGKKDGKKLRCLSSSVVGEEGRRECRESQERTDGGVAVTVWSSWISLSSLEKQGGWLQSRLTHWKVSEKVCKDWSSKEVLYPVVLSWPPLITQVCTHTNTLPSTFSKNCASWGVTHSCDKC